MFLITEIYIDYHSVRLESVGGLGGKKHKKVTIPIGGTATERVKKELSTCHPLSAVL